ncbi:MAG: FHA domain-containing protein, partial [Myxococcales bacterium]|nr:FHA domain-containing protein [Myxococcales bacterium]
AAQPAPYVAPAAQPTPAMPAQPAAYAATVAPGAGAQVAVARLVSILKDGSDGQAFPLKEGSTDIGRSEGDIVLADDPYLSPRHARVRGASGRFYLRDLDSANGVYMRLTAPADLVSGDHILIGQQVLRFELLNDGELPLGPAHLGGVLAFGTPEVPRFARLVQYTTEGVGRDLHYLYRDETILGRENGDIVFTDDPFLSRRHAAIEIERSSKRCRLKDVGSSNGTSLRVRGERELVHGDHFRVGRHLFRFDMNAGAGR